jgi:hypothetical protein
MSVDEDLGFPAGGVDERELLLGWLEYLRGGVVRKVHGVYDQGARWTPDGRLISLLGIVNQLTHVEWSWVDGGMLGAEVSRSESEFRPGPELGIDDARSRYRERGRRPVLRCRPWVRSPPRVAGGKARPVSRHRSGSPRPGSARHRRHPAVDPGLQGDDVPQLVSQVPPARLVLNPGLADGRRIEQALGGQAPFGQELFGPWT